MKKQPTPRQFHQFDEAALSMQGRLDRLTTEWERITGTTINDYDDEMSWVGMQLHCASACLEMAMQNIDEMRDGRPLSR
jgi:hypothetical protein